LQITELMRFDANIGKPTEAGIDSINRATFSNYSFYDCPRSVTTCSGRAREPHMLPTFSDVDNLLKGKFLTA
jgi:hypothetical protein